MSDAHWALCLEGICKGFSGVQVLRNIDFSVARGEIRALLGANGAGKSTLIKIASGVYTHDSGRILISGREKRFRGPLDAYRSGIAVVHQETSLVPTATAAQNVFMGREKKRGLMLDERAMLKEYRTLSDALGVSIPAGKKVKELGAAEKKLVEIMKAVSRDSSILIMDEPTDSLGRHEIDSLFRVIRDLKSRGMTIIYITHFLGEVAELADNATVLRDGAVVATRPAKEMSTKDLVGLILGRQQLEAEAIGAAARLGGERLVARGLSRAGEFRDVSFELRKGEVVGVVGVVGSGKTELARALSGASRLHGGTVSVDGRPIRLRSPREALASGIGMTPEDRKAHGLVLDGTVAHNVSLASLGRVSVAGVIDAAGEKAAVSASVARLSTTYASLTQRIRYLSGGNQQKCIVARWLLASPDVFVLDEPTRGVDIGAKAEIYAIVRRLASEGKSVIYFSGEPQEILSVADRIMVMQRGAIKRRYETRPTEAELLNDMLEVEDAR